jgi:hypothetical protein
VDGWKELGVKKVAVLSLVLGLASGANAALSLVGGTDPIEVGETTTIFVANSVGGAYSGWLSLPIGSPYVANIQTVEWTPEGNPSNASVFTAYLDPADPMTSWFEFTVMSVPPAPQIAAGNHMKLTIAGLAEGTSRLNLYGPDGEQVVAFVDINVVPEPMTLVLLGLGGLFLLRRR